jgi:hypothetical protein
LQVSKRGKATDRCRTKGAKTGKHKRKESNADWGIEFSVLSDFDLLLLNYTWILDFVRTHHSVPPPLLSFKDQTLAFT